MLELPAASPPQSAKTAPVAGPRHAGSEAASGFVDHLQDAFDRSRPAAPQDEIAGERPESRATSSVAPVSEPTAAVQADALEEKSSDVTDLATAPEGNAAPGVIPNGTVASTLPVAEEGRAFGNAAVAAQAQSVASASPVAETQPAPLQAGSRPGQVAAAGQAQVASNAIEGGHQPLTAAEADAQIAAPSALPDNPALAEAHMAALPSGEAQKTEIAAKALARAVSPGVDGVLGPAASLAQAATKDGNAHAALSSKTPMAAIKPEAEAVKPADPAVLLSRAITAAMAAREVGQEPAKMAEAAAPVAGLLAPQLPGAEEGAEVPQGTAQVLMPVETAQRRAEAVLHSQAVRDAAPPPPPPTRQLAPVLVSMALGRGDDSLTIALDPGELGRVEVSISHSKEAGQIRIVAERPETLALLQRDQRELDRALSQAGLGDLGRSIAFSLASDQGRQREQGNGQDKGKRSASLVLGADGDRLIAPVPVQNRVSTSLIDLAV